MNKYLKKYIYIKTSLKVLLYLDRIFKHIKFLCNNICLNKFFYKFFLLNHI